MQLLAVVPHPPLLVPALAAGRSGELARLLGCCDAAVAELVDQAPPVVVCVGAGTRTTRHPRNAWGTFAGFGADVPAGPVAGVRPAAVARLPLSLTVGHWLLERAGWRGEVVCQEVDAAATAQACRDLGRDLQTETAAEFGPDAGWLVLGDGDDPVARQVLAGAVTARGGRPRPGRPRYDADPYGVRYLVASWWLAD